VVSDGKRCFFAGRAASGQMALVSFQNVLGIGAGGGQSGAFPTLLMNQLKGSLRMAQFIFAGTWYVMIGVIAPQ